MNETATPSPSNTPGPVNLTQLQDVVNAINNYLEKHEPSPPPPATPLSPDIFNQRYQLNDNQVLTA